MWWPFTRSKVEIKPDHSDKKYLGKRPARKGSIKLRTGEYIIRPITLPRSFGYINNRIDWQMLGNDVCGNCVVAGAAHETMLMNNAVGRGITPFDDHTVIAEYMSSSGWNGVQDDPSDIGLDMQEFASIRRKRGIKDSLGKTHKILAYTSIVGINELLQSCYMFGMAGVGIMLTQKAMEQFDRREPWTLDNDTSPVLGSHYLPCVGRNSHGHLVFITWGRLHAASPEFVYRYMDEAVAYISEEFLNSKGLTPRLFNLEKLKSDLSMFGK